MQELRLFSCPMLSEFPRRPLLGISVNRGAGVPRLLARDKLLPSLGRWASVVVHINSNSVGVASRRKEQRWMLASGPPVPAMSNTTW